MTVGGDARATASAGDVAMASAGGDVIEAFFCTPLDALAIDNVLVN